MAEVIMDKHETALAEKYGLKVSTSGDRFVVIDPELPKHKGRYEGGNLYSLMLKALDERKKTKPHKEPRKEVMPIAEQHPTIDDRPPSVEVGAVKSNVISNRFKQAEPKEVEVTKKVKQGKLYVIKNMVLENPGISNDEIAKKLKDDGMPSPLSTIMSVRADFVSTVNLLKKMGRYKEG